MTMLCPSLIEAWGLVRGQLPPEAIPIIGWSGVAAVPPLPSPWCAIRLIFALPASRVASLRHWRHEAEVWTDDAHLHVVAVEASVAARTLLVGEPTVAQWAQGQVLDGTNSVDEATFSELFSSGDAVEFERVDRWLVDLRERTS
jgi:hypothetical protein